MFKSPWIWSWSDLELLREEYPNGDTRQLAQRLNRAVASVHQRAHAMGIKKTPDYRKFLALRPDSWTKDELAKLRELYPRTNARILAKELNRQYSALRVKASQLGLRREFPNATEKQCATCSVLKPADQFYTYTYRGGKRTEQPRSVCKMCLGQRGADRRLAIRKVVISYYSGGTDVCACCGEGHIEFLSIDHIGGGGGKHRKAVGNFYAWILREDFPPGFRVLCHNCNQALGLFGACPHESEKESAWGT